MKRPKFKKEILFYGQAMGTYQCKSCGKWNNFLKVCHSKQKKDVHAVNESGSESSTEGNNLFIDAVHRTQQNDRNRQAFAELKVGPNQNTVNFKLDTGSSANIIPTHMFSMIGRSQRLNQSHIHFIDIEENVCL